MTSISSRQVTQDDKEFVWQLSVLCFRDVVIRQFGQWDNDWQVANFDRHWCPEKCSIVLRDDAPVGILSTWRETEGMFLSQVLIHPDHQNQGIGSSLLRGVMAEAEAGGMPVRLQVLSENGRALSLYQRLGFAVSDTIEPYVRLEYNGEQGAPADAKRPRR